MSWEYVQSNWKRLHGQVRQQWGLLTDNDLRSINGRRAALVAKLQERYGRPRQKVEQDVKQFCDACRVH